MLKKILSDKMHRFFFRVLHIISFTFNSRFAYDIKAYFSKTVRGIFHFRFRLVLIKVYIFIQQKAWTLWF